MFSKILVPLDGSALAEQALPFAIDFVNRLSAKLELVSIVQAEHLIPTITKKVNSNLSETKEYVECVQQIITDPAFVNKIAPDNVEVRVIGDRQVIELSNIAIEDGADLIVMTSHGRGGLSRLFLGSHAAAILRHSRIPIILIHPDEIKTMQALEESLAFPPANSSSISSDTILLTLDGTKEAELAITPGIEIARLLGKKVSLLRVGSQTADSEYNYLIRDYGGFYGAEVAIANKQTRKEPYLYLEGMQQKLENDQISFNNVVREGEPTKEILEYAAQLKPYMIIMATHAPSSLGDFWLGSVAHEVMHDSHLPVMMVNVNLYKQPQPRPPLN